jgi:hypothetical protein
VYGLLAESDDDSQVRRLVAWIENQGGVATARDLARGPREYRGAGKAEVALKGLAGAGVGVWEAAPGGRTIQFRLLPTETDPDGDTSAAGDRA